MRVQIIAAAVALSSPAFAQDTPRAQLDALAGEWIVFDEAGRQVGHSQVVAQVPGTMLFEQRVIGDKPPQPLWFENAERNNGWTQLFVGPAGMTREFKPMSPPGQWPIVMGSDVVLQDGTPVKFRMTVSPISDDAFRRLLEISRDSGANWKSVFDYRYRRKQ